MHKNILCQKYCLNIFKSMQEDIIRKLSKYGNRSLCKVAENGFRDLEVLVGRFRVSRAEGSPEYIHM